MTEDMPFLDGAVPDIRCSGANIGMGRAESFFSHRGGLLLTVAN